MSTNERQMRQERVAALTRAGYSATQIAFRLGCTPRTVTRDRVVTGTAKPPTVPLSEWQITEGARLEASGVYPAEIARTIGCSADTAHARWPANKLTPMETGQAAVLAVLSRQILEGVA